MASSAEEKRSRLLQADAAMASLQADIEQRRDNNLAKIQQTSDALHNSVDEQMRVLRQNVQDETANSLSLIKERREKLASLASKFKQVGSGRSEFTEEQITEINRQYAELQCGAVEEIYQGKYRPTDVSFPNLESTVVPVYKTEVILPQLDSFARRSSSSKSPSKSPELPPAPSIEPSNCSVEDIDVPKGKNSSFTLTLRDSEGEVVKGCSSSIKVTVLAVGKGIFEAVCIEERANGVYNVSYTPKHGACYQITIKVDGKQLPGSPYTVQPFWRDYSQLGKDVKIVDGFNFPWGVVCGPDNEIIITVPHKLQVIDPRKLKVIKEYGSEGSGQGQFCGPNGIAIHSTNNATVLAVSDCRNHRIQKFSYFHKDTTITPLAVIGKKGEDELEFNMPRGLTYTAGGSLVVCDSENHRVQVISRNNKFIRSFGGKGSDPGQFNEPYDVAVYGYNAIIVTDRLNNRVQCFTMDGQFTSTFDITDNHFPRGVFVSPDQSVIITAGSGGSDKILIVKEEEKPIAFGKKGRGPGEFNLPMGVTMDTEGRVVLADHWNKRIMVLT